MLQTCYSDFYNKNFESEKLYKGKDYSNNKKIRLELDSLGFIKKYIKKLSHQM